MVSKEKGPAATTGGKLSVSGLSIAFGGLKAVQNFGLELPARSLYGLIGPNGAGKTTIFNLLTGIYAPDEGRLELDGQSLLGMQPHDIAKSGLARTFQNIRLAAHLSVLENVLVPMHTRVAYNYFDLLVRNEKFLRWEKEARDEAMSLLKLMGLDHRAQDLAQDLSYGDGRRLEIARALALHPKVLLLDEPAAGLNSGEKVELMRTVDKIRNTFPLSILLIDHDMKLVMGICERIVVVDHGEVLAEGVPKDIQGNAKVVEAYLGTG